MGGEVYDLTILGTVTDLGGTPLGAQQTPSFTVESTPPTVSSYVVVASDDVAITFSEAMAPVSITQSSLSQAGSVRLYSGTCAAMGSEIFACVSLSEDGLTVTVDPSPDASDSGAILTGDHCIVVTTGVTDQGGTPLAAQELLDVTF